MDTRAGEWAVMTWNLQGSKDTDLSRVAATVIEATTDAVVFQEVRRPQAEHLASELSMASVWHAKHHPTRPFRRGRAEGAAILSAHALVATGHAQVSSASSKRNFRRRIVQWAVVERADGSSCRLFNTHLSPHDLAAERRAEAVRIARLVDGSERITRSWWPATSTMREHRKSLTSCPGSRCSLRRRRIRQRIRLHVSTTSSCRRQRAGSRCQLQPAAARGRPCRIISR